MMNAARNTGGSIGISIANNVLAHREQRHQSGLIEHASPSSLGYQNAGRRRPHGALTTALIFEPRSRLF
jgi:hypothetical protein